MLNKIQFIFLSFFLTGNVFAQEKPKIVIGIVVDQMTNDYLYRFNVNFGEDGFNRLMSDGFYFPNTMLNYMVTSTGPGHASIYTGTTPSLHGITDNFWYDRNLKKNMYCVEDNIEIWLSDNKVKKRSPSNLIGSTITDMLSLSTYGNSKIIGISLKDRGAVLPIGHSGDLALWWDNNTEEWTTGSYYTSETPTWISAFNQKHPAESYLKEWQFSVKVEQVSNFIYPEHNKYEQSLGLDVGTTMPYDLKSIAKKSGISILKSTPFGNTYTFDLAKKAIIEEKLGKGESTDFLCLSFSSTDFIGHKFGPYSREVEDTYIRFDKDLAEFLKFLDETIGDNNYLLFFTSDHGVVPNVDYLKSQNYSGSHYNAQSIKKDLNAHLLKIYKTDDLVLFINEYQIYLDREKISLENIELKKVLRSVTDHLNDNENIIAALSSQDFLYKNYEDFPRKEMQSSYYHGRSGDVLFTWKPFMRSNEYKKGTGHGSPFTYDKNVPLIWYGNGIRNGRSYQNVFITQIASTLADLLQIQRPPFCTSESLIHVIGK